MMTTIGLADRLHLRLAQNPSANENSRWQVTSDAADVPSYEHNICYRAAELFFDAAGISKKALSLAIHIEKKIPAAAGLGGGSADAAAVLRFLWKCWHEGLASAFDLDVNHISEQTIFHIALRCGADVPFCIEGGTRFCRGVGEKMSTAVVVPSWPVLIAKDAMSVRTAGAFQLLDRMRSSAHLSEANPLPEDLVHDWSACLETADPEKIAPWISNDFLDALSKPIPAIARLTDAMQQTKAFAVSMTGSGPTCFSLFLSERERDRTFTSLSSALPEVNWIKTEIASQSDTLDV